MKDVTNHDANLEIELTASGGKWIVKNCRYESRGAEYLNTVIEAIQTNDNAKISSILKDGIDLFDYISYEISPSMVKYRVYYSHKDDINQNYGSELGWRISDIGNGFLRNLAIEAVFDRIEQLMGAIDRRDLPASKIYFDELMRMNPSAGNKTLSLVHAIGVGDPSIVEYFLKGIAKPSKNFLVKAIELAFLFSNRKIADDLSIYLTDKCYDKVSDTFNFDYSREWWLSAARASGDLETIRLALDCGASINGHDIGLSHVIQVGWIRRPDRHEMEENKAVLRVVAEYLTIKSLSRELAISIRPGSGSWVWRNLPSFDQSGSSYLIASPGFTGEITHMDVPFIELVRRTYGSRFANEIRAIVDRYDGDPPVFTTFSSGPRRIFALQEYRIKDPLTAAKVLAEKKMAREKENAEYIVRVEHNRKTSNAIEKGLISIIFLAAAVIIAFWLKSCANVVLSKTKDNSIEKIDNGPKMLHVNEKIGLKRVKPSASTDEDVFSPVAIRLTEDRIRTAYKEQAKIGRNYQKAHLIRRMPS